jgi:hypothetical protein
LLKLLPWNGIYFPSMDPAKYVERAFIYVSIHYP